MVKVVALDTYERLKVADKEYGARIPEGTEFVVSEDRLQILLGNNRFNEPFVRLAKDEPKVEEAVVEEKPKKRGRKKKE